MPTLDGFNLRALVRQVLDDSDAADPTTLSREVLARIEVADIAEALRQAMPTVVHNVVSVARMREPAFITDTRMIDQVTANTRSARSPKVAAIREMWRQQLHTRYAVGNGEWRLLRDCTADNLDHAATYRDEQARRNAAAADKLRALRKLVVDHDVATVGQLPEAVLRDQLDDS